MTSVVAALAFCRFAQDAAALMLWGAAAFLVGLVPPGLAAEVAVRLRAGADAAIALAVVATIARLPAEAAAIGSGWPDALDPATLRAVAFETSAGLSWQVQAVAAASLLLAPVLPPRGRLVLVTAASGLMLAATSLTGHAVMQEGPIGALHRANDVLHVLAAGAWLGALAPVLVILQDLDAPERRRDAMLALRRFSRAGHGAVALVLLSGTANAVLTLGRWPTDLRLALRRAARSQDHLRRRHGRARSAQSLCRRAAFVARQGREPGAPARHARGISARLRGHRPRRGVRVARSGLNGPLCSQTPAVRGPAMFKARLQSFAETADPSTGAGRLAALRAELKRRGLDGFVVPRSDEHQSEYVPAGAERLAWLTGFTGSAGIALVLREAAAVFVDGRYTVQVRQQIDTRAFTPEPLVDHPPEAWIGEHLEAGEKLGFDPWLHTPGAVDKLKAAVEERGGTLVPVETNPIDAIWPDRPAMPRGAVSLHPEALAGLDRTAKLALVREKLGEGETLLVSDPHAVAWLFNIRGSDVGHTPLPLGYSLVPKSGKPILYLDGAKLSNSVRATLSDGAEIAEPAGLAQDIARLGAEKRRLRFDSATASSKLVEALRDAGGTPEVGADPIALLKAQKTTAERQGSREAHRRDAAAFARFLHWFAIEAPKGHLTEIAAVEALESFRHDTGVLKDLSFPTIAGAGPNAAIPHYRVTAASNRRIEPGIFLVDSGAQYEDGTTDITRTIAVGEPDLAMRDTYTRVLKGHIAIARAVFPPGTTGAQLDPFARQHLWRAGLDFDHGTGHGVGSYLSVHEGPQRIAKSGTQALLPGMILSNEPGYYRAGAWGIRIENLLLVEERAIPGGERPMLGFETLTFAPIDRALIELPLLDREERDWLDAYHARVREIVAPLVEPEVRAWLEGVTGPLGTP